MRLPGIMLLAAMLAMSAQGRAEDSPEQGKAAYANCISCHGVQAEGNRELNAPRLNQLAPVYMVAQLQKFRSGLRGGDGASDSARQMAAMAATLENDQAMYDTVAYIASLQGQVSPPTVQGDAGQGGSYYQQYCAACHGPAAQGNLALNSPRLAGADDWYLVAQLNAFRNGSRGAHPEDRTGRQMRAMAGVLPDEQAVASVVAYIRSLEQ